MTVRACWCWSTALHTLGILPLKPSTLCSQLWIAKGTRRPLHQQTICIIGTVEMQVLAEMGRLAARTSTTMGEPLENLDALQVATEGTSRRCVVLCTHAVAGRILPAVPDVLHGALDA